ncbi:replication-relaxation family protein [Yinghuangia seranimata]|uniref:replication-relaxation family protein n=1 Tax=Yinghuangia seranimata TaxID=408067 RepID=UPI00248B3C23|nr:replication-relaxation family protein [Yinghuangia seranimata]MDI2130577.1 replication-relaxation family protein [Yinghuangia seranimata]
MPAHARTAAAQLAARLTARDWWLIEMLHTHRVLTTTQVLRLAYTARRTATARLARLATYGVIDTFRPLKETGSAPAHLVLGPTGAAALAARRATTVRELPWRAYDAARIAHSAQLAHNVGANEVMVRLAAEHRTRPDRELRLWLPAHACTQLWGDWIRPDAYGLHHDSEDTDEPRRARPGNRVPRRAPGAVPEDLAVHPGTRVTGFFLEYDRGTETAWRVAAKLVGYAAHASGTATRTPVLIHTPDPVREHLLRTRIADHTADLDLPVATTHAGLTPAEQPLHLERFDHDRSPTAADPVWLPLHPATRHIASGAHRLQLRDLAAYFGGLVPALDLAAADNEPGAPAPDWQAVPPLPPPGTRGTR